MATERAGGLAWSSDGGGTCPRCRQPKVACRCAQSPPRPRGDGVVRVSRETKGRKGAGVTVVSGVPLDGDALKDLARELKALCGSGGTVKEGRIEVQGDHRDRILAALAARGWTVRRAGG